MKQGPFQSMYHNWYHRNAEMSCTRLGLPDTSIYSQVRYRDMYDGRQRRKSLRRSPIRDTRFPQVQLEYPLVAVDVWNLRCHACEACPLTG